MKIDKRYLVVPSVLALCAIVSAVALGQLANSDEQQQVQFLTNFYKNYLSRPRMGVDFLLPPSSFYSKRAEALIANNDALCNTLSRGDDICGYGANYDVFLSAQEIAPDLTFARSQFKAVRSGKNTVDVSFSVWPKEGKYYQRQLRYVLVREKAGWRVDDVFFEDHGGAFPATRSMRYQINEENQHVLNQARDVSKVLDWVFTYLSQRDMLDRIERSMAFPVQICDKAGNCQAMAKQDPKLQQTLNVLHRAYYNGDTNETISWNNFFAKENPERLVEGTTVKMDALELTFQGKAWWIIKIDLKALGRRIPVH